MNVGESIELHKFAACVPACLLIARHYGFQSHAPTPHATTSQSQSPPEKNIHRSAMSSLGTRLRGGGLRPDVVGLAGFRARAPGLAGLAGAGRQQHPWRRRSSTRALASLGPAAGDSRLRSTTATAAAAAAAALALGLSATWLALASGDNGAHQCEAAGSAGSTAATAATAATVTAEESSEGAGSVDESSSEEEGVDGSSFYIPPSAEESKIKMKIFSGNGNWHLANEISMHLGVQLGRATVKRFPDGEVSVNIHDNVRGKDVFVVQPLSPPVNENLMELVLMVTTLRRSSARRITAVIPYYGYCRTTTKTGEGRTPIAAADVARMLQVAGVDRVIAVDLHHDQIKGFFGPNTPVDNLDVSSLAIPYFSSKFLKRPVVVSPDANGAARAKVFRDKLIRHKIDASLALIVDHASMRRGWEAKAKAAKEAAKGAGATEAGAEEKPDDNSDASRDWLPSELEGMELVGDVAGRDCIIFDDIIDSGGRITRAAKKLKMQGARRVFCFATHGLFLGHANERIDHSELIEVVCVNTVPLATSTTRGVRSWVYSNKVHQLSIAALLAETIRRINKKKSVSNLS